MPRAPVYEIDPAAFHADPYPDLARMRAEAPICHVPQLGATLFTRRDDIFAQEKRVEVFSSHQPDGLMSLLMGENMMRKDGAAHADERKATFPAFSPRTVRDHWKAQFEAACAAILDALAPQGGCELVRDFAMPVSGAALRVITGLTQLSPAEIDAASQAMIDGIANYAGLAEVEARCRAATATLDAAVDQARDLDPLSLVAVQRAAGLPDQSVKANVKLAISGGQNEPRDAIAGTAWALLTHPDQLELVRGGAASWRDAFEEYARWISPIGMSPRRIARADSVGGVDLEPEGRVFFMFGSGNRDEAVFDAPERFDITRDTAPSLAFGAGPHFCAGAAASRVLIAEVALPMLFERLPGLRLAGEAPFAGWAFRGPLSLPLAWG
ncbi:putative cytochrome P450 hydroxylase [Candidatus Rhodobacter oscarellae]|uniref:Putative cytochrome P450 hydroxylase n=1 Tax=Candidatus Rhodobacter oscarellae TaxID=1675527 RepID=A0A0J9E5H7_9RHOB|nr:cytochrome P450 [Candidatus Rhodobacter lobularis]KMW57074.1 putative cytochrome P450 hydroxylase [Candidatus Rhodobacter lobularis]